MLFYNYNGELIEILRYNYKTDKQYYIAIMNIMKK
jgi:hypothetical protein